MDTTDVLWAAWEGRGFEHLALSMEPGAVRADSLIIAVDDDSHPYRARYVVECDAGCAPHLSNPSPCSLPRGRGRFGE